MPEEKVRLPSRNHGVRARPFVGLKSGPGGLGSKLNTSASVRFSARSSIFKLH